MADASEAGDLRRQMKRLMRRGAILRPLAGDIGASTAGGDYEILTPGPVGSAGADRLCGARVQQWHDAGYVVACDVGDGLRLSEAGRLYVKRLLSRSDAQIHPADGCGPGLVREGNGDRSAARSSHGHGYGHGHSHGRGRGARGTSGSVSPRCAEQGAGGGVDASVVARLSRLKGPDGEALICPAARSAAERLAADFTLGQMMPRTTMVWGGVGAGGGRRGFRDTELSLGERALAARERFRGALKAVGPEFAGVLCDLCCHDVGLGEIEARRHWPRRSGKVIAGMALRALARHYGYRVEAQFESERSGPIA